MYWRWNAQRLAISAFVAFHVVVVVIWCSPACPIRAAVNETTRYYMLPLGLWEYWTMFAPDPVRNTITLEAEVTDAKGVRYTFAFPRMADYTLWQGIPRFRHSKYAANLSDPEFEIPRKFAARHAVRRLKLQADSFPVETHLLYQVRTTPPPGQPAADPMAPTSPVVLGHFQFGSIAEVYP